MERFQVQVDSAGQDLTLAPVKWWCYDAASAQKVIPVVQAIGQAGRRKPAGGNFYNVTAEEMESYTALRSHYPLFQCPVLVINGR